MSGVNMQRFAKSSHLWPLSVFKHSPDELGFQTFHRVVGAAAGEQPVNGPVYAVN